MKGGKIEEERHERWEDKRRETKGGKIEEERRKVGR